VHDTRDHHASLPRQPSLGCCLTLQPVHRDCKGINNPAFAAIRSVSDHKRDGVTTRSTGGPKMPLLPEEVPRCATRGTTSSIYVSFAGKQSTACCGQTQFDYSIQAGVNKKLVFGSIYYAIIKIYKKMSVMVIYLTFEFNILCDM